MFQALKLCPQAKVVHGDMRKYVEEGRIIRRMMEELTPQVQPLSIDEAFMDLTGTEALRHAVAPQDPYPDAAALLADLEIVERRLDRGKKEKADPLAMAAFETMRK